MNFHQSIFQNNNLKIIKYLALITLIFLLSFKANTEIPEKYKIESSLPKCKGTDYKKWTNCYGEYKFPRIEYKGEWKDGSFDGKGALYEQSGKVYFGDFKNNLMHGKGYFEDPVEGTYEGDLKNDRPDGYGKVLGIDGEIYEGQIKEGMPEGQGKMTFGHVYFEGEFKRGYLNGKGKSCGTKDNITTCYTGDHKDMTPHGYGVMEYLNATYEGEFVLGLQEGKGITKYDDGSIHEGEYKNDLANGKGIYIDSTSEYRGDFKEGLFHGKGVYIYSEGEYRGDFISNVFDGEGIIKYNDGNHFKGQFNKGTIHGQGIFTWTDGEIYEGSYYDGIRQGKGKYTYASGAIYEGDWYDNLEHGFGKIVYSDGTFYEGEWKYGEKQDSNIVPNFTTDEKYYALIIGNNDYEKLEDLDNAINDAQELEKVLKEKYGFETILKINQSADETEEAIIEFTENREKNDNILIYYAGHGQLLKKQKLERGYWLPIDAGPKRDSKWISNNNIKDSIASSNAKHILLIVDSCFSGSLMRGSAQNKSVEELTQNTVDRLKNKTTRLVITSGGNELVADGIGESKNSVFAEPLINILKNNNDVIRSIELFVEIHKYVTNNADQTPNHALLHGTGHDGGDFLFFPKS